MPCRCVCVQEGDSEATKTIGAAVNAAAFVAVVTAMTFLLVFLFKRGVSLKGMQMSRQ